MKLNRSTKRKMRKQMKGLASNSPFATKSSTNWKFILITPLSAAGAIAGATWMNRRFKSDPKLLLARGAQKLAAEIDKSKDFIDLTAHPEAEQALQGARHSLTELSTELTRSASRSRTLAHS